MKLFSSVIWISVCIIFIVSSLASLACVEKKPETATSQKSIVVTYSILGSVVKELVGDQANVTVLMPNGIDPHDWEPSAKDIEAVNRADLVIRNGLGLEAGMDKALEQAAARGVKIFTATEHIKIRYVGSDGDTASDQDTGSPDPHFWLDPLAMRDMVRGLGESLKTNLNLDVSDRTADLANRLEKLNIEVENILSAVPPEDRKLVTGHESMGYFADRYGFKLIGVIIPSLSSQAGVSAANLAALKKAIIENKVKAIFTELGTSPAVAAQISEEIGVKVVEIGTHFLPPHGSYFTFMRNIATTVAEALR